MKRVDGTSWQLRAACADAYPPAFFPERETQDALLAVTRAFCDQCAVQAECLNYALVHRDAGFWGGTTTDQREKLLRERTRAKCPLCCGVTLVATGTHEICVRCGASWRAGARPPEKSGRRVSTGRTENVVIETEGIL